jgi:hypothetical protein
MLNGSDLRATVASVTRSLHCSPRYCGIGHALAFDTWRSLVREQGLSDAEAVELMAGLVRL